jgi:hypothetical protein
VRKIIEHTRKEISSLMVAGLIDYDNGKSGG